MPAAVYKKPGVVVVEERPVPSPAGDEVLVEVDHCGICGSDIHMLLEGWGEKPGTVAGHEYSGTIVAIGEQVRGWSLGEKVVGGPSPRCGVCRRCLGGQPSQCEKDPGPMAEGRDGAFASYVLVPAAALLRIPEGLEPRRAALAEPLAVALHGITRSGVSPGDTVMVMGAGPIGALCVAALVARGIGPVTVVEPFEPRRRLARRLGASAAIDPADLEKFPPWEPERMAKHPVDVVLECSGHKAAMETGFHQLGKGGTMVLVGAGIHQPSFDPNRFLLNELTVRGSYIYDRDGFGQALELLGTDSFPADALIEADDVPLDRISDTLTGLAEGRFAGKVMVVPRLSGAPSPSARNQGRDPKYRHDQEDQR